MLTQESGFFLKLVSWEKNLKHVSVKCQVSVGMIF
jgi:hypothetical protein